MDGWCVHSSGALFQLFQTDLSLRLRAKQDPHSQVTVLAPFLFNIFSILLLPSETNTSYYHKAALRYTSNAITWIITLSWKKENAPVIQPFLPLGPSAPSTYELPNQSSLNPTPVAHRDASSLWNPHSRPWAPCLWMMPSKPKHQFIYN